MGINSLEDLNRHVLMEEHLESNEHHRIGGQIQYANFLSDFFLTADYQADLYHIRERFQDKYDIPPILQEHFDMHFHDLYTSQQVIRTLIDQHGLNRKRFFEDQNGLFERIYETKKPHDITLKPYGLLIQQNGNYKKRRQLLGYVNPVRGMDLSIHHAFQLLQENKSPIPKLKDMCFYVTDKGRPKPDNIIAEIKDSLLRNRNRTISHEYRHKIDQFFFHPEYVIFKETAATLYEEKLLRFKIEDTAGSRLQLCKIEGSLRIDQEKNHQTGIIIADSVREKALEHLKEINLSAPSLSFMVSFAGIHLEEKMEATRHYLQNEGTTDI
ncbi:MAG: hypothetical protein ACQESG_03265 [Nanobdellota archaeon]